METACVPAGAAKRNVKGLLRGNWLGFAFPRLNRQKLGAGPRNLENVLVVLAGPTDRLMQAAAMLEISTSADLSMKQSGENLLIRTC